jgi:hypothetical protein
MPASTGIFRGPEASYGEVYTRGEVLVLLPHNMKARNWGCYCKITESSGDLYSSARGVERIEREEKTEKMP